MSLAPSSNADVRICLVDGVRTIFILIPLIVLMRECIHVSCRVRCMIVCPMNVRLCGNDTLLYDSCLGGSVHVVLGWSVCQLGGWSASFRAVGCVVNLHPPTWLVG